MNKEEKFWNRFGGIIRKTRNDCPLTPEEAKKELDALSEDDEEPLTDAEVEQSIEKILTRDFEPKPAAPDLEWVQGFSAEDVDEDVFALNRNLGDADADVDARVDELRKKASDEEDDEGENETGLEAPEKPPGKGG